MSNNPEKVSVSFIVIAHNEQERIATALTSLLDQETTKNFEIIVVDDGSTDNTVQAAKEAMANFQLQQIISFPSNRGRGAARLAGQMRAMGEYLAFIDSDVSVPANWLERAWSAVVNEGLDAVSGIAIPDGDCVVIARIAHLDPKVRGGSAALTGNNLFIKREVIAKMPFQNIPYGDDIRLAWDLELAGYKTRSLTDLLVNHAESKSFKRTVVWQYQQGKEATSLLWDYRKLRVPDSAWFGSLALTLIPIVLLKKNLLAGIGTMQLLYCLLVSAAFLHSRFQLKFQQHKTYLAIGVNLIFIVAYVLGRYRGLLTVLNFLKGANNEY
jgi:glycosyltransferase involved in cell wall biosynthesis